MPMFGMEFSDNQISRHDASIQIKTVLLFAILDVVRNTVQSHALWKMSFCLEGYSSSHNHGIGKWLYLKGNYYWRYWRDPLFTSRTEGG